MRKIFGLLRPALILPVLAVCALPAAAEDEPYTTKVHIFVYPVGDELAPPSPFKRVGKHWFSSFLQLFPYTEIAGFGYAIESTAAMAYFEGEGNRLAASSRDAARKFDYLAAVTAGAETLGTGAAWQPSGVEVYAYGHFLGRFAYNVIDDTGSDFVLFLKATYFPSPNLDQVRLHVQAMIYEDSIIPDHAERIIGRTYEYLSPSRGNLFRSWRPGEKEAMIEAIELQYASKLEQYPHNKKAYAKDRRNALRALKGRDTILPTMAVCEGWPDDAIPAALQTATDEVFATIRQDLAEIREHGRKDRKWVEFEGLDLTGKPDTFKGNLIGTSQTHDTYRDRKGNLYILPNRTASLENRL